MSTEQQQDSDNINLEEVSNVGRPLLKGTHTIRCISCEKQKSKKGNEMLVFQWEICSPTTTKVMVNETTEKEVNIAGMKMTDWIVFNDMGLSRFKSLHKIAKLPMVLNKKAPNTKQYIGKAVKATIMTEPQVVKDEVTGEPIVDGETGNPIVTNNYRIQRFISGDDEHTMPADSVAF